MKHVADVLVVLGAVVLVVAGFTVTITVGLALLATVLLAGGVVLAKLTAPAKLEVDDA